MKKKYNHKPQPESEKSPTTGLQPNSSTAPANSTGRQPWKPTLKMLRHVYECQREAFLPIKVPPGWNGEQDVQAYIKSWGESDDYWSEIAKRMEHNLGEAHSVLSSGIHYYASKREPPLDVSPSTLTLREKVRLFTELLPSSADREYTSRFAMALASLLWLESERERISESQSGDPWLYPVFRLADGFLGAALELYESLVCENDDYKAWLGS